MKELLLNGQWDIAWRKYQMSMAMGFGCDFYIRTTRPNPDIPSMVNLIQPNEAGLTLSLAKETNEDALTELGHFGCEFLKLFNEMDKMVKFRKQHVDELKSLRHK